MPNLNNLCTSLELSKRLKELGCKQDSLFYWAEPITDVWIVTDSNSGSLRYSAYTAGELGEMLPANVDGATIDTFKNGKTGKWHFWYRNRGVNAKHAINDVDTEANCRALMLIYLLTSNLINVTK